MADVEPQGSPFAGRRIADLADLDAKLAEIAVSPDGPAAHFGEFWFDMPVDPELDPLSPAYRNVVLGHYRRLAGPTRPATASPEMGPDDALVIRPWPYNTGVGAQVGQLLQAIGFVIALCRLRRGHRVLQMGAGTANLALPLAQMGCSVTALDADLRNVSIMQRRAERLGVRLRVLQAGFDGAALDGELFDFVLFHAAFHRCENHLYLLRLVREQLLAPGGRLVLAGEPLLEALPSPWGLDPTGSGIWMMRHFGGHSLVFRPSYLLQALAACGYEASLTICSQATLGNVIVAVRSSVTEGITA